MLALEHVLSGAQGIVGLVLSSTVASMEEWVREVKRLRAALPPDVVATLDRLEAAEAYDDPDYEAAENVLFERHMYRGPQPRPELERMRAERGRDVYRAMMGPNEWTATGALRGWDVRDRLGEIRVPTLVVRGRHDMSTDAINETLLRGIPHAESVVLEESSHTPVLEETARYLDVLRRFLDAAEG
jgi:L-proline amide hydrolase